MKALSIINLIFSLLFILFLLNPPRGFGLAEIPIISAAFGLWAIAFSVIAFYNAQKAGKS